MGTKIQFWDKIGVFVSSLCIVHCLIFPLMMVIFPSLALVLGFDVDHTHMLLLVFLVPAAFFAIYSGYKVHGEKRPLYAMALGFAFVLFGTLHGFGWVPHKLEPVLVLIGSVIMVRAHFINSHHCKKCEAEQHCIWEHDHHTDHHHH
ncbi:MAG: MerC domain-containing protein [Bdellovibrionales bacterium]